MGSVAMNEIDAIMKQTNVIDWMLICIKMMWESDLNGSGGVGGSFHTDNIGAARGWAGGGKW